MSRKITINVKGLQSILDKFDELDEGGTARLVKAHARLCCIQLAARTQPFTVGDKNGSKGLSRGQKRIKFDVERVIHSQGDMMELANKMYSEDYSKDLKKFALAENYDEVIDLLKKTGLIKKYGAAEGSIISGKSVLQTVHDEHRNRKSGRTRGNTDKLYMTKQKGLNSYIKNAQKRVGMSKAGWADCARKLNVVAGDGARGIPAWAKKASHGQNGNVADHSTAKPYGYVTLKNELPWTSNILTNTERDIALKFAKQGFIKGLEKAFNAAARARTKSMKEEVENQLQSTNR